MAGQRVGYTRVGSFDQHTARQLDGIDLDRVFTDKASGKDVARPELDALLRFASVPTASDKIVITVSIYDAEARSQSFGQVRNAYIRVVNQADNVELTRYDLTEDASNETAMIFGELYRRTGSVGCGRR